MYRKASSCLLQSVTRDDVTELVLKERMAPICRRADACIRRAMKLPALVKPALSTPEYRPAQSHSA